LTVQWIQIKHHVGSDQAPTALGVCCIQTQDPVALLGINCNSLLLLPARVAEDRLTFPIGDPAAMAAEQRQYEAALDMEQTGLAGEGFLDGLEDIGMRRDQAIPLATAALRGVQGNIREHGTPSLLSGINLQLNESALGGVARSFAAFDLSPVASPAKLRGTCRLGAACTWPSWRFVNSACI
jgi:hypothetical protein